MYKNWTPSVHRLHCKETTGFRAGWKPERLSQTLAEWKEEHTVTVGSIAVDPDIPIGVMQQTLSAMYEYTEDGEFKELFSEVGITIR